MMPFDKSTNFLKVTQKILIWDFTLLECFLFCFFISGQNCERVQTAPAWRLAPDVIDVDVRAETELFLNREFTHTISFLLFKPAKETELGEFLIIVAMENLENRFSAAKKKLKMHKSCSLVEGLVLCVFSLFQATPSLQWVTGPQNTLWQVRPGPTTRVKWSSTPSAHESNSLSSTLKEGNRYQELESPLQLHW